MLVSNQKASPASSSLPARPKPFCLVILDGWGINPLVEGNAIAMAKTPNLDRLCADFPCAELGTSGEDVGLPEGQMGNSEVGHLNIGAGRIVYQDYSRINKAIANGTFLKDLVLLSAIENVRMNDSGVHLMGLLSEGGVHSHEKHLYALLELLKQQKVENVYIHIFLDGRDVPPRSALKYIKLLEDRITEIGVGKIATVSGRYYAMDRDCRWDRTKKAYDTICYGHGEMAKTAEQAVRQSYEQDVVDEFVRPTVIADGKRKNGNKDKQLVEDGDSVIFFNFRSDRARQLTRAFMEKNFSHFDRGVDPPKVFFVTMTQYDKNFDIPVVFPLEDVPNTLAHVVAENGLTQLHIAETEKYAHVTFFLNGGIEEEETGETRILIPSPKVPTYDQKPEMSAAGVTDRVIDEISKDSFDVVIVNFANPDMVGHTAVMESIINAVETVDSSVGCIYEAVKAKKGALMVISDHGNADQVIDYQTGKPYTAHTVNPVPMVLAMAGDYHLKEHGILADVAPTILQILGIKKPSEMSGSSMIERA